MIGPIPGNNTNGIWWSPKFQSQPNGTVIYFLVEAFDLKNNTGFWPDNYPPFSYPNSIIVQYARTPYFSYVYFTLNSLTINDLIQQSNVTIESIGYLPKIPELPYVSVDVVSEGPHAYRFPFFMQPYGTRFLYLGQSSGLIDLKGSPNQIPYDTYTISIDVTFPYRFENLSYVASTPVYLFTSNDVGNSWSYSPAKAIWVAVGNSTVLRMESTLMRRLPTYYPPLVLMLVAFAILGLMPLVSVYHHEKRYDLFLNVIILASSAELSEAVSPPFGFRGDNIFLESFAFILVAAVVMMAISSLPEDVRSKALRGFKLEFFTTIVIVAGATLLISTTNFPRMAKWIVLLGGSSGVIMTLIYVYVPRWLLVFSKRLRKMKDSIERSVQSYPE
jgi:hypothetical protein